MRATAVLTAAIIIAGLSQTFASGVPVEAIEAIGCAGGSHVPQDSVPAADTLDVSIVASRTWGVVPFEVDLEIVILQGSDSLLGASWDFDGDGAADASGLTTTHVFSSPIDYQVRADVQTAKHGTMAGAIDIAGYSAVMSLTFDDGQHSVLDIAAPLMESRGVVGTSYVVPTWVGTGWYMDWNDLATLEGRGWEIGSHSLTHQDLYTADSVTVEYELSQSAAELRSRGFEAKHFAVPYGSCTKMITRISKHYYQSCRGWKGENPPLNQVDPYLLRWDVTSKTRSLASYQLMIDSVAAYGGWYILNSHIVNTTCDYLTTCVTVETLAGIIDYAISQRVKIVDIDEGLAARASFLGRTGENLGTTRPRAEGFELSIENAARGGPPFTVRFGVPPGVPARIDIFDVRGRLVKHLPATSGAADGYALWSGEDSGGKRVASGLYFCVLRTGPDALVVRKIVVVR